MLDLSALRKFEVLGADAGDLLQIACTRNIRRLAEGQVVIQQHVTNMGVCWTTALCSVWVGIGSAGSAATNTAANGCASLPRNAA